MRTPTEHELLPEHQVYAEEVKAAIKDCEIAVRAAEQERNRRIAEALATCQSVLRTRREEATA